MDRNEIFEIIKVYLDRQYNEREYSLGRLANDLADELAERWRVEHVELETKLHLYEKLIENSSFKMATKVLKNGNHNSTGKD